MKLIFVALSLFISFGCTLNKEKDEEKENWNKEVDSTVNHWVGRQMFLPTTLSIIDSGFTNPSFHSLYMEPLKMVTFIDGDCGMCTSSLENWKNFIEYIRQNKAKCDFIFYIQTNFPKNFQQRTYSTFKMPVPWILDSNAVFTGKNNLWDKRFQTALLNEKNEVIMIGDMRERPQLENLYKQQIINSGK